MKQIRFLFISICVSTVLLLVHVTVIGQVALEPSYEVSLQLLTGSNTASAKGALPANLSAISQQLKSNFNYAGFRLTGTILGRVSNAGDFHYKGGSKIGIEPISYPQSFLDWSLRGLHVGKTEKGTPALSFQALSFGARVPVATGIVKDETGKERSSVNYEHIGLNLAKVGLPANVPTLIGTLNLPGGEDTVFLVVTVKSVEQ